MQINNIKDLRDDLLAKYQAAKKDDQIKELGTFTACASSIIRSLKVELDYKKYHEDKSKIDFLEDGTKP